MSTLKLTARDFAHQPSAIGVALKRQMLVRKVIKRAEAGYYRDRLILVTYVEKSANTTISDCLARIQLRLGPDAGHPQPGYGERRQPDYVRPYDDHTLRPELLIDRPNGGVVNRIFAPVHSQLAFLEALAAKYFVVLRHPADQVAAMFTYIPERMSSRWTNSPVFALPWDLVGAADKDEIVKGFIEDGYLVSLLKFIADWLEKRDQENSMVLRFEDFIADRHAFFKRAAMFLYAREPDAALLGELDGIAETGHAERKSRNTEERRYTHGPTDRPGIWRDYFGPSHLEAYRRVTAKFLELYPSARLIRNFYPDLLLENDDVSPGRAGSVATKQ